MVAQSFALSLLRTLLFASAVGISQAATAYFNLYSDAACSTCLLSAALDDNVCYSGSGISLKVLLVGNSLYQNAYMEDCCAGDAAQAVVAADGACLDLGTGTGVSYSTSPMCAVSSIYTDGCDDAEDVTVAADDDDGTNDDGTNDDGTNDDGTNDDDGGGDDFFSDDSWSEMLFWVCHDSYAVETSALVWDNVELDQYDSNDLEDLEEAIYDAKTECRDYCDGFCTDGAVQIVYTCDDDLDDDEAFPGLENCQLHNWESIGWWPGRYSCSDLGDRSDFGNVLIDEDGRVIGMNNGTVTGWYLSQDLGIWDATTSTYVILLGEEFVGCDYTVSAAPRFGGGLSLLGALLPMVVMFIVTFQ